MVHPNLRPALCGLLYLGGSWSSNPNFDAIVLPREYLRRKQKIEGAGLGAESLVSSAETLPQHQIRCLLHRQRAKGDGPSRTDVAAGLLQDCIGGVLCAYVWRQCNERQAVEEKDSGQVRW